MLQKTPLADDLLWRSLAHIYEFYRLRLDSALIQAQVAIDWTQPLQLHDLVRVARHVGLEVEERAVTAGDLDGFRIPVVIPCADGEYRVFVPGSGFWDPAEQRQADLPSASGKLFRVLTLEKTAPDAVKVMDSDRQTGAHDWFWKPFWSHKGDFVDLAVTTFFINMFALLMPVYTKNVYDRVVPNHAEETLVALTIGIVLAFAFNLGFKMVRGHVLETMAARLASHFDDQLMDHILHLNASGSSLTVGEKSDLFREIQNLRDFFAARLMPAVLDLPFFLMFLVVIYLIGPGLLPVVAGGIVLMFLVNLALAASVNRTSDTQFKETRRKNAVLVELLSGASSIRLFNAVGSHLRGWSRVADRSTQAAQHSQHVMELAGDISITVTYLINVLLIVVGVGEIQAGNLSVGSLVAASILVGRALAPVMTLAMVAGRLRQSLDSLRVIGRIFALPAEARLTADYQPKGSFSGRLTLEDVTYYHPGQVRPTLYHMSLSIAAGEKIGLIGRTGAGKSTITRLLDGTLKPQSGLVMADGYLLDAIHPVEWRGSLGIVPQDSFFFSASIRENILMGAAEGVDEAWLDQVLSMSGLAMLLSQAGHGIDSQIGEGGQRLSGGQKQAIAIARALIRRPDILLLDEPTNGMDHDLEQHVKASLKEFAHNRTLVLVTHRTSLLGLVDRLVVVDGGRIAADGPRDAVLKQLAGEPAGSAMR
jgi:ATP-binding cassette subfamily B protein/ATP-binding cassette subfamily C protein LapB